MSPWGVDGGGRCIAAGGAGPGSEQPHGSPRCGAGQLRPPARVPAGGCGRPEPRGGCPGEGAQPRSPPQRASGRGATALGSLQNPTFWRETRKKAPHQAPKPPWGAGGSCPPLGLRPPTCRAPQSRAAAGISLPAGLASAATLLRLFLSSSPPSSSSSSLPLPAAWGSLWRFIHSCLPIGPSAFPCLPEAERVTPRPFPATFCCHRAALPQPQGAAGPGHAWASQVVGASPREGWG